PVEALAMIQKGSTDRNALSGSNGVVLGHLPSMVIVILCMVSVSSLAELRISVMYRRGTVLFRGKPCRSVIGRSECGERPENGQTKRTTGFASERRGASGPWRLLCWLDRDGSRLRTTASREAGSSGVLRTQRSRAVPSACPRCRRRAQYRKQQPLCGSIVSLRLRSLSQWLPPVVVPSD